MALLLRALRDVRILSGDFDLVPPLDEGTSPDVSPLPRNFRELDDTSPRFEFPFVPGATPQYDIV